MVKLLMLLAGRETLVRYRFVIYLLALSGLIFSAVMTRDIFIDGHIDLSPWILLTMLTVSLTLNVLSGETAIKRGLSIFVSMMLIIAILIASFYSNENGYIKKVLFSVMEVSLLLNGIFRVASGNIIRHPKWLFGAMLGVAQIVTGCTLIVSSSFLHSCLVLGGWLIVLFLSFSFTVWRVYLQWQRLPAGHSITLLPYFINKRREVIYPWQQPAFPTDVASYPMTIHIWQAFTDAKQQTQRYVIDRYIGVVNVEGGFCTGHAAMQFGKAGYISLYPFNDIAPEAHELRQLLLAGESNDRRGRYLPSLVEEINHWRHPDISLQFLHYNEYALSNYWRANQHNDTYNLTARNCSTTVISALDVALEGCLAQQLTRLVSLLFQPAFWGASLIRERAEIMTWTPGLVRDYAYLMRKMQPRLAQSVMQRNISS